MSIWTVSDLKLPQRSGVWESPLPRGNENGRSHQKRGNSDGGTRCDGDGRVSGGRGGGRSGSNVSPKTNDLKTPLALLHEICTKGNARVVFPSEELVSSKKGGQQFFQCIVQVTTKNGDVYKGTGIGTNKQNAKHAAARNVLYQLHPGSEAYMIPDELGQPVELEVREEDVRTPPMEEIQSRPGVIQYQSSDSGHPEREQNTVTNVVDPCEEELGVGEVSVCAGDGRIYITVDLPKSKSQQQQNTLNLSQKTLSPCEKIEMVKGWRGPKIEKLKRYTEEAIEKIKSPIMVSERISEEQNLNIEFVTKEVNSNDPSLKFSCFMEVTPFLNEESSPYFVFTMYGFGDSPEDAQVAAARNFLHMIRALMNSYA